VENIIVVQQWQSLMLEIQIYSLSDYVYTHEESIKEGIQKPIIIIIIILTKISSVQGNNIHYYSIRQIDQLIIFEQKHLILYQ